MLGTRHENWSAIRIQCSQTSTRPDVEYSHFDSTILLRLISFRISRNNEVMNLLGGPRACFVLSFVIRENLRLEWFAIVSAKITVLIIFVCSFLDFTFSISFPVCFTWVSLYVSQFLYYIPYTRVCLYHPTTVYLPFIILSISGLKRGEHTAFYKRAPKYLTVVPPV